MTTTIQVTFPGGKRVDADVDGMTIHTDQPVKDGGQGSAPGPFQLFMASIASCAGYYALNFCDARKISTKGMALAMDCGFDDSKKMYSKFTLRLTLPDGFPEKYREAIVRAMDQCYVKKHITDRPEFDIAVN